MSTIKSNEPLEGNPKLEDSTTMDLEEDETIQDWSEISKLSRANDILSIPKRGEKDYEPDGTDTQELLLYRARKAMFDTLSNSVRGTVIKSQVKAYYIPDKHIAIVPQPKGNFMQTMGESDSSGNYFLRFYEFLYLSERGTISPYWEIKESENQKEIPLSIEDIYALFQSQDEIDNFSIYAHLKRLGFIVQHAAETSLKKASFYPQKNNLRHSVNSIFRDITSNCTSYRNSLFNGLFYKQWSFHYKRYTTTPELYQSLNRLISYNSIPKSTNDLYEEKRRSNIETDNDSKLKIAFNVWKPNPSFKKKIPELPDYQIVTYNKNDNKQKFPTYKELKKLFKSLDYKFTFLKNSQDEMFWNQHTYNNNVLRSEILENLQRNSKGKDKVNPEKKCAPKMTKQKKPRKELPPHIQQMIRLKAGYRSFLLAVMDNGIISFIKISETDFGSENVWYVPQPNASNNRLQNRQQNRKRPPQTPKHIVI